MKILFRIPICCVLILWATIANGQWQCLTKSTILAGTTIQSLTTINSSLFAGTDGGGFRTDDFGQTWVRVHYDQTVFRRDTTYPVRFCADGSTLYAFFNYTCHPLISTDMGVTWNSDTLGLSQMQLRQTSVYSIRIINGRRLLASDVGIMISDGFGAQWSMAQIDLPAGSIVYDIVALDTVLFAASNAGIYRSKDGGENWDKLSSIGGGIRAILSIDSSLVSGIYVSNDFGDNWKPYTIGARSLTTDICQTFLDNAASIFTGSKDVGVWMSVRSAPPHWSAINQGFPAHLSGTDSLRPSITALAVCGGYLFSGTSQGPNTYSSDAGVWRRAISDFQNADVEVDHSGSVAISPNPATNFVTIPAAAHVTVTNLLGMTVLDVTNHDRSNLTLDVSELPAGTYFVRSDGSSALQKLIKE